MTQSRFWRSIGTIAYLFSGILMAVLAFQAVRARFSLYKHQSTSEEHPQSVIIMGIGSRLIAPTRIELRDIEDVINRSPTLFSHIPRILGKRSRNSIPQVQIPSASITTPLIDILPDTSVFQFPASSPTTRATKQGLGKRALVLVSSLLLTAIIATSFLFSVRIFSASLGQPAKAQANAAQSAKPAQPAPVRPVFERGIIYPQWYSAGYGVSDTTWQQGVATIKTQTGAQWIEIPVLFSQATSHSTHIQPTASAPSVQSFSEGIARAHSLGYKVFFVPLMQVRETGGWSGSITFTTLALQQAWFDGYWNTILPYVFAAASLHVEQMAIGTELQALQQIVPDALWDQLISRIRGIFQNTLTYDMNWSSLALLPMPTWLRNASLTYIGVSTYIPLLDKSGRVDPQSMPALWRDKIKTQLDALAGQIGKQVLISEIGYRNSSDALYHTWESTTTAKADPQEQAGAFDATLTNVFSDAHIAGTFFWGWDDVGRFAFSGQLATQVLLKWYTLKQV
jgi:hypothetical protein